jgi:hypothetical protein
MQLPFSGASTLQTILEISLYESKRAFVAALQISSQVIFPLQATNLKRVLQGLRCPFTKVKMMIKQAEYAMFELLQDKHKWKCKNVCPF